MKTLVISAGAALLLCSLQALALEPIVSNCSEPQAPVSVPDGHAADFGAMKVSHDAHKAFNVAGNDYLACLDRNAESQRRAAVVAYGYGERLNARLQQIDAGYLAAYNAFVDRLHIVAERFNVELRNFKARRIAKRSSPGAQPPDRP